MSELGKGKEGTKFMMETGRMIKIIVRRVNLDYDKCSNGNEEARSRGP